MNARYILAEMQNKKEGKTFDPRAFFRYVALWVSHKKGASVTDISEVLELTVADVELMLYSSPMMIFDADNSEVVE